MVKSLPPQEPNDNNERDDLDPSNFSPPYLADVDDYEFFQDYSSDHQNMFYLDYDGYESYLDGNDENQGDIDEDDPFFQMKYSFKIRIIKIVHHVLLKIRVTIMM
jgi:hypothetical protein